MTSSALPTSRPSTWSMSVISAVVDSPAWLATATRLSARSRAIASVSQKAPEPHFTSITSPSRPAATFLDRIELTISGIDSTVAVTSRTP